MNLSDVILATGMSRSSIYRSMAEGDFPRPLKLSERSNRWLSSELDAWIAGRSRAVIGGCDG